MKKIWYITLLSLPLIITSCESKDDLISLIIKTEQENLNNYNNIKRMTTDTVVVNFIDSLKNHYVKDAYEVKGALKSNTGIINGGLEKSLILINTYIDSLK